MTLSGETDTEVRISVGGWRGQIGRIDYAFLGFEDHGVFAFELGFDFGGTHQGLGYIVLDSKSARAERALELLEQLTRVVGPITGCVGKQVIVLRESDQWNEPIRGVQSLIGGNRVVWKEYQ